MALTDDDVEQKHCNKPHGHPPGRWFIGHSRAVPPGLAALG
tara:strand:- start:991 stop:1113 length:123 start_codon:yes stop_codon:yes gene_type:complete